MDALRQAVRHGYRNAAAVEGNQTFAPLRDRADFRELLDALRAKGDGMQ